MGLPTGKVTWPCLPRSPPASLDAGVISGPLSDGHPVLRVPSHPWVPAGTPSGCPWTQAGHPLITLLPSANILPQRLSCFSLNSRTAFSGDPSLQPGGASSLPVSGWQWEFETRDWGSADWVSGAASPGLDSSQREGFRRSAGDTPTRRGMQRGCPGGCEAVFEGQRPFTVTSPAGRQQETSLP